MKTQMSRSSLALCGLVCLLPLALPANFQELHENFDTQIVGEKPVGYFLDPEGPNVGETTPFPVPTGIGEALGIVVVDENSSPAPAIPGRGKSLRMYDYATFDGMTGGRASLIHKYLPDGESSPQVRLDFSFRRSLARDVSGASHHGLLVALGTTAGERQLWIDATNRAVEIRLRNTGVIRAVGTTEAIFVRFEPFEEINTHKVSVFANAQADPVSYQGPDGQVHELGGFQFSMFLNDQPADGNTNRSFSPAIALDSLGLITGNAYGTVGIDFVLDDIHLSPFADVTVNPPVLSIENGEAPGSARLFWIGEAGVNYRIQHSQDLLSWITGEQLFTGEGIEIDHVENLGETAQRYFRLMVENATGDAP